MRHLPYSLSLDHHRQAEILCKAPVGKGKSPRHRRAGSFRALRSNWTGSRLEARVLVGNAGLDRRSAAVVADGQSHRHRIHGPGQVGYRAFAGTPLGGHSQPRSGSPAPRSRVHHRNREGFFSFTLASPAGRAGSGSGGPPQRHGLGEPG